MCHHERRVLAGDACSVAAARVLHLHQQVVRTGPRAVVLLVRAPVHARRHHGAAVARERLAEARRRLGRPRPRPVPPVHERDLRRQLHGLAVDSSTGLSPNTALTVPRTRSPCSTSRTLADDVVCRRALARQGTGPGTASSCCLIGLTCGSRSV